MNPALPVILVLGVVGILLFRGPWRLAWGVYAIAATVFLWPALRLENGIPSPSASLARMDPWTAVADADAGNPTLLDVTFQIQPWLGFLRQEYRAGSLPFWNPYQFSGAPFWANGQSAPLFPLHLLFAALPLQVGWVLLPWLRILIAGLGAWALARQLGVGPRCALVAGLAFPLGGMVSSFLLFPMANALCLVPWILRQVDRLARGQGSWGGLAMLAGLQLLGGHPETFVHTAMLSALYFVFQPCARRLRPWIPFLGAWLLAGFIAAIQMLPLAQNLFASSRWHYGTGDSEPAALALLLQQPLRLIFPNAYGHPADETWWGPFNYNATAVFAGLLVLLLSWVALRTHLKDSRWRAVAVALVFCLLAAYHAPGLRQVLLAIPLVSSMLHHRLLFAVDLFLGLLAAAGLQSVLAGRGRAALEATALLLAAMAIGWWRFGREWSSRELLAEPVAWTAWGLTAGLLVLFAARPGRAARTAIPLVASALVLAELVAAHGRTNPPLKIEQLFPSTPAIEFLEGKEERIAGVGWTLRPNAAMVYGLYDVRGDDTIKSGRYEEVYGTFGGASPFYFEPVEDWNSPWLDRLAVRWVISGPHQPPKEKDWVRVWRSEDGQVWERPSAWPLVRWQGGDGRGVKGERRGSGRWRLVWQRPGGGMLVVAENWDRGWQATVDGQPVTVEPIDGVLIGVPVEGDRGEVLLTYRPPGFGLGLVFSLAGLLLAALGSRRPSEALGEER